MIASALTEKNDPDNGISFSRVSGAIGSVGLAAFMSGLGLWVFFALNSAPDGSASLVARLDELRVYLLGSAALFAPYAANQINGLFSRR